VSLAYFGFASKVRSVDAALRDLPEEVLRQSCCMRIPGTGAIAREHLRQAHFLTRLQSLRVARYRGRDATSSPL
jgi:hypothetical protein